MSSSESSLRRRSRGSIPGLSRQPTAGSDGFGSFVEASAFPSTFDSGFSDNDLSDNLHRTELVSSPSALVGDHRESKPAAGLGNSVSPRNLPLSPQKHASPQRKSIGSRGASSEWSDWDSFLAAHSLPKADKAGETGGGKPRNPADDAFFDAFEVATQHNRAPSPPIMDLRDVERKLDLKKKPHTLEEEDDFFSKFERAPQRALGRASPLVLEPEQLDSMRDAKLTPMTALSNQTGASDSYFGQSEPKPIQTTGVRKAAASQPDPALSVSPTSPSSWGGSLRRGWSTLRGIPTEFANHLPSASDFLVPPEEGEAKNPAHETNPGGGLFFASQEPRRDSSSSQHELKSSESRPRGSIVHATDYSQSTPFGATSSTSHSGFSAGAAADASASISSTGRLRARDLFAGNEKNDSHGVASQRRGPVHSSTAPISGAPGFDTSSTRKWNTGQWTLDDSSKPDKRVIPVTLSDRRDETDCVIEQWHASRIQASLPPRLQLGKRWRLLYSLDQHGISLQTLYHRVSSGLDPTKAGSSGGAEAEGWLRGASKATQQALGMGRQGAGSNGKFHVGGGLSSVSDAGIVLSIKDENDNVFGAFINEKLRPQQHYYGSGECFLYKTAGFDETTKSIELFRWTGKNDYMVLSESTFLSVGGGNGKFGLWIDGALDKGVSDCCPAFDNEALCDKNPKGHGNRVSEKQFTCYGLEVWAVGLD